MTNNDQAELERLRKFDRERAIRWSTEAMEYKAEIKWLRKALRIERSNRYT